MCWFRVCLVRAAGGGAPRGCRVAECAAARGDAQGGCVNMRRQACAGALRLSVRRWPLSCRACGRRGARPNGWLRLTPGIRRGQCRRALAALVRGHCGHQPCQPLGVCAPTVVSAHLVYAGDVSCPHDKAHHWVRLYRGEGRDVVVVVARSAVAKVFSPCAVQIRGTVMGLLAPRTISFGVGSRV